MGPDTWKPASEGRTVVECSNRLTAGSRPRRRYPGPPMLSASSAISDPEAPSEVVEGERPGGARRVVDWFKTRGPRLRGLFAFLLYVASSILVFALPVIGDLGNRCVGSCLSDTYLYEWSFDWMHQAISTGARPRVRK